MTEIWEIHKWWLDWRQWATATLPETNSKVYPGKMRVSKFGMPLEKGTGCLASILTLFFLAGGRGAMEMFPSLTNQELSARSQVGCNTWIQFNKRSSFEKGKSSSKQPIFVKYKNTSSIFWSVIQKIRCYHLIFVLSWWVFWRFAIRSIAMTRQMRNVTIVRMTRRINYVSLPKSTLRFLR